MNATERTRPGWRRALAGILFAFIFWSGLSVRAEPRSQVRLLLANESARPGQTIWGAVQFTIPPPWHIYWRNGGDAGEPPSVKWNFPDGITAGPFQWPVPLKDIDRSSDYSLITYVYRNEVLLPVPFTLPKDLPPGPVTLQAAVHWMECSDICVFADANTSAKLTIAGEDKPSASAALIEQWRNRVPPPAPAADVAAAWESTAVSSNSRPVILSWHGNATPADFYPYADTNFSVSGDTQTLPSADGWIRLSKLVQTNSPEWPHRIAGIFVGHVGAEHPVAVEADMAITAPLAESAATSPVGGSLAIMFGLAFLGGLILNIMPCVLPVISLKILGFVQQSGEERARVRRLGLIYGTGVLFSFLVLAGFAIAVRHAGGVANWGDLFRHPAVQIALTILMTLIALNLFGVFEVTLSGSTMGAASQLASRPGYAGAFFNGLLATLLATPCTAPFLTTALAFAFTQSAPVIVLIFAAAGMGLAFPFVVLCLQPQWLKFLPKPGVWMENFKIAMGFPMLATAVWLLWLTAVRPDEVLWLGLFLVILALAAWIWGRFVQRGLSRRGIAAVVCLLVLAGDGFLLSHSRPDVNAITWQAWSPQAVAEARQSGHPVLVDFTARSCLTCQLNRISSLDIPSTRAELKKIGAVALEGDFTRENPEIAEELKHFGRPGVPLVLVYPKNANQPPQALPVILTPAIVQRALEQAN